MAGRFATRIANAVVSYLLDSNLLQHVGEAGAQFAALLQGLASSPIVGGVDRLGMAYGIRVEAMKGSPAENALVARELRSRAFAEHVIVQTAGVDGDRIKLAPSFLMSEQETVAASQTLTRIAGELSGDGHR